MGWRKMQQRTQRHISPASSGYGTPTDMKPLGLLLSRTWEAWHGMKGNPSYSKNKATARKHGGLSGLPGWVSPRDPQPDTHTQTHTHRSSHPLLCCLFSCLLVTSLSVQSLQWDVDLFTFVSRFISTPLPSSSIPPPPPPPASSLALHIIFHSYSGTINM